MSVLHIRIAIGVAIFIIVVAAGYSFAVSLPKIYSASTVVHIIPSGNPESISTTEQMNFIQRQIDLLQSDARIASLIEKLDLREQIAEEINARPSLLEDDQLIQFIKQSRLKFKPYNKPNLIIIKAYAHSKSKAMAMAQTMAEMHDASSATGAVEIKHPAKAASRPEKPNIPVMLLGSALLGGIVGLCIGAGFPISTNKTKS
ncbi:MAG: hypothetical protein AAF984_07190 [Verrucomicrobiota bacterium]